MIPYAFPSRMPTFTDPQRWGLCRCSCHEQAYEDDPFSGRPASDEHGLCQSCADEAYLPWTTTLDLLT
jgi:hypothetical protein